MVDIFSCVYIYKSHINNFDRFPCTFHFIMPFTSDVLLALRTINDLRSLKTHASEDTRVRACAAYFFLNFHQEEIARTYSVSQSTVSRWLKDCLDSDRVETRGREETIY
ncbi:hypothetical protein GEMRC1_003989 [Eukaryota sp. GEM-RC1]